MFCYIIAESPLKILVCVPNVLTSQNTETPIPGDKERFIQLGQSERTREQDFSNLSSPKAKVGCFYAAREWERESFRELRG